MTELEELIKQHDWTYEWADDMRSYRAGSFSKSKIISKAKEQKLTTEKLIEMFPEWVKNDGALVSGWRREYERT